MFALVCSNNVSEHGIETSAGPDLLDLSDPRIYFFKCLGSGAKRIFRIFMTRILVTDLPDLIPSDLAFLLFIGYVKWQKTCN